MVGGESVPFKTIRKQHLLQSQGCWSHRKDQAQRSNLNSWREVHSALTDITPPPPQTKGRTVQLPLSRAWERRDDGVAESALLTAQQALQSTEHPSRAPSHGEGHKVSTSTHVTVQVL